MSAAAAGTALKLQLGARTLATIRRRLIRVPLTLSAAIAGTPPVLPTLPAGADGYLVTSLPRARLDAVRAAQPALLLHVRQRYDRHHADLTIGFAAFWAGLSGNARSQLKRKARRVAEASGGVLAITRARTPDELAAFHPVARAISALTYQERLMGGGLPADPAFVQAMLRAGAADRARGWLLTIGGRPAAYLYGEAEGDVLRYDHVGHDPAFAELSPGSVLMVEAFRDLMGADGRGDRFARFDFTEGDGQHKRGFATGAVACVDVLLLRPTLANRLTIAALAGFDAAAARAKRVATHPALKGLARRIRRAS